MKELSLDEVLEYYNRMDFKTGEQKLYRDFDSRTTKEMAIEEIEKRTKAYRIENKIEEKVAVLEQLLSKIKPCGTALCSVFIDTYDGSDVQHLADIISCQSQKKINHNFIDTANDIRSRIKDLYEIGENDPDNLRYQSKFPGSNNHPYHYNYDALMHNIQMHNYHFIYKISPQIYELTISLILSISNSDLIIYPYFASKASKELLIDFIIMFNAINNKVRPKLLVMLVNDLNFDEQSEQKFEEKSSNLIHSVIGNKFFYSNNIKFISINNQKYKASDYSDLLLLIDNIFMKK
jgi:hypothetical protein